MIEVIYKEEKQEADGNENTFTVPRNIRQIGLIHKNYRIYMEDYVYTFLRSTAQSANEEGKGKNCLAVLLGEAKWADGATYIFIRGALLADETEMTSEHIDFTEEMWTKIHEEEETYFKGQEIVGWFFAQQSLPLVVTEVFQRAHLRYFGGGEKVLMLMDPAEREDAFFRYENGYLMKQDGYYIFYEKNLQMQDYMQMLNQEMPSETLDEVPDEAVKTFRRIIRGKQMEKQKEQETRISVFSYAATACLAIAVLAVGTNFYQNYQRLHAVEDRAVQVAAIADDEETEVPKITKSPTLSPTQKGETTAKNGANTSENVVANVSANTNVAVTPTPTITPTPTLDPIYAEESDVRKANLRVAKTEESTAETITESTAKESSADGLRESYVIRPGDTLYHISMMKYGNIDVIPEICRINGFSQEEIIYPGQIIVLP